MNTFKNLSRHIFFQIIFALITLGIVKAQNFSGIWYGNSPLTNAEGYHLSSAEPSGEMLSINTIENNKITGYCYSYYWFRGDFYYDISTLEGSINPLNQKLEFRTTLIENHLYYAHYYCPKNFSMTFSNKNNREFLNGIWSSDSFENCGSGTGNFSRQKPVYPKSLNTEQFKLLLKKFIDENPVKENNNPVIVVTDSIKKILNSISFINVNKRTNTILKTITVTSPDIKIEIWDSGVIDNDTVTVYFNKNLILRKGRISKQPITFQLKALPNRENELVMYADNLGDIPPNTAEMRIFVDGKRYNVTLSSDEKTNGTVRFLLLKKSDD